MVAMSVRTICDDRRDSGLHEPKTPQLKIGLNDYDNGWNEPNYMLFAPAKRCEIQCIERDAWCKASAPTSSRVGP